MSAATAGFALALLLFCLAPPARAERHIWTVPGTQVVPPYCGLLWDARTGTLIVTRCNQVLRLDPVSGASAVLGEVRWESEAHRDGAGGEGPALDFPALTPDGAVEVTVQSGNDHRLLRFGRDGAVQVIAGHIGDDWRFQGDGPDALRADFTAYGLAVGPDGARYLADWNNGRVLRVDPGVPAAAGQGDPPRGIRALAGNGKAGWEWFAAPGVSGAGYDTARHAPLTVPVKPWGVAMTPGDGVLFSSTTGCILSLTPRPGREGTCAWELARIAGNGEWRVDDQEAAEDARTIALGIPNQVAAGDGRIYAAATGSLLWQFTPREGAAAGLWRCELLAGRAGAETQDAVPARQATFRHEAQGVTDILGLAAGPGGGLLVATSHRGIRYLGPPPSATGHSSDAELAAQVQAYREHQAQDRRAEAQAIMAALLRLRDQSIPETSRTPFRSLCKQGELSTALPAVLNRHIGSFLIDPVVTRFRAALAIQATGDGHLHPAPAPAWAQAGVAETRD